MKLMPLINKEKLDKICVNKRETYDDLVLKLLKDYKETKEQK